MLQNYLIYFAHHKLFYSPNCVGQIVLIIGAFTLQHQHVHHNANLAFPYTSRYIKPTKSTVCPTLLKEVKSPIGNTTSRAVSVLSSGSWGSLSTGLFCRGRSAHLRLFLRISPHVCQIRQPSQWRIDWV